MKLSDLPTPSFVVNRAAFVSNCAKVKLEVTKKEGIIRFRPHVKTHKTMEGAFIQAFCRPPPSSLEMGSTWDQYEVFADGFVASTIPEIEMLLAAAKKYKPILEKRCSKSDNPFLDIVFAVPISKEKLVRIDAILEKYSSEMRNLFDQVLSISILVDHPYQVEMIESFGKGTTKCFTAFLKLDTGYHRAGISCDGRGIELAMKVLASKAVRLKGLYTHCGHAYDTNSGDGLDEIAKSDLSNILHFIKDLRAHASSGTDKELRLMDLQCIDDLIVSVGSTPSLFHHTHGKAAEEKKLQDSYLEIHPGNYCFYDRQQLWTGAAEDENCVAGRVVSRVIGHYEDRRTIMLDAGATALTKDASPQGDVCAISGRPDLECYKMSQEVTLVRPRDPSASSRELFEGFPLGSIVTLLPNHSCLSAACFDRYYVIDDKDISFADDQEIVDEWVPVKGW